MPYITIDRQRAIESGEDYPRTPGELNYLITRNCLDYLEELPPGYAAFNTVMGVLESAKLEFYRRMVAAYEDLKIKENGDVY